MIEIFCDGGVISRNPSKLGGTWAWVRVEDGKITKKKSGVVTPEQVGLDYITNNLTELYAALKALECHPKFDEVLYSDSMVTVNRLLHGKSFNGIPQEIRLQCLDLCRNRRWTAKLVGGHPTRKELRAGFRERNGLMVSRFNVLCDKLCTKRAREFLR